MVKIVHTPCKLNNVVITIIYTFLIQNALITGHYQKKAINNICIPFVAA